MRVRLATFGGGAVPILCRGPIRRHIVAAAKHCAGREHGANMSRSGGLVEQGQSGRMILWSADAVQRHVGQHDLRLDHPDIRGGGYPGTSLLGVLFHAAAFDQHAAVPILRVDHAVRCSTQPLRGFLVVPFHANTFGQTDAEVERGDQVTGFRRLLEPFPCVDRILQIAMALQ